MKWASVLALVLVFILTPFSIEAKGKRSYALSLKIFKKLEAAQLMIEEENYQAALEKLNETLSSNTSPYEKAQIFNVMGSVYYRMNDYEGALTSFASILDFAGKMPESLHYQTLKTVSQLNMMEENYIEAKKYCEQLVAVSEQPDQKDFALLAQANFKLELWQEAIETAQKGKAIADEQQKIPDENLFIILSGAYFESDQLSEMPPVLHELIKHYPRPSYMLYLASIYGQLERLDKQLVLMESLYEDEKLVERSQIRNLATLYMSEETPYKAAKVLEKAFTDGTIEPSLRDLEMLAQAWRLAAEREKSLDVLGQAAQVSDDGRIYLQKAYLHFDMAQWDEAVISALSSMDKGLEDKHLGEAWLLLGMTKFKLKKFTEAIRACQEAKKFDDSKKHAGQWITYITSEKQKYEMMQAPVS